MKPPILSVIGEVPPKKEIAGPGSADSPTWERYAKQDREKLRKLIGRPPDVEAYLDQAPTWREMSRWACDLIEKEWNHAYLETTRPG